MRRSIWFAAVLAVSSLPAATALSQGTDTRPPTPERQRPQAQSPSPEGQRAQTPTPDATPQADQKGAALAKQDRDFVDDAAIGGLYEVKAGQLAAQKAQTEDLKHFAQRMIDDHTAANARLQALAQQKGLAVPQQLDKKHQDKLADLSKKSGTDFDKAYIDAMVDDHKKDVNDFDKAAKDAKDQSIKDFASTTLPTLREHLQMAQTLKDKMKT